MSKSEKKEQVSIRFDPEDFSKSYERSVVRRFLYEYLYKRSKMMMRPLSRVGGKSWMVAKGVKDYILMLGKTSFTYMEVSELIESGAVLNYIQDMQRYMLFHWKDYSDNKECFYMNEE